jgi:hypothetical protein
MQAFPNPHLTHQTGMLLRDYFAAKAMHGLIPQFREMFMDNSIEGCWVSDVIPELAKEAYYMADEMMKARDAQA